MTMVNDFSQEQLADLEQNDEYAGLPSGTSAKQIMRESGNNPAALSKAGALGYAQVMPTTLASLNKQLGRNLDPSNWQDAMVIQRTLMKQNMDHFGNPAEALAAYNGGWDRSKWDNPETQAYVAALAGGASVATPSTYTGNIPRGGGDPNADDPDNPLLAHFKGGSGTAAGTTAIDRELGYRANASGLETSNADASNEVAQGARTDMDASLYQSIGQETANQVASETQHASAFETFKQGFEWNTITGRMIDHAEQDANDPNFKWTPDTVGAFQQAHPEIYNNDEMREYVLGAGSDTQAQQRIDAANQHLDFQRRYANTNGLAGAGDFLAAQMGAMADPVVLLGTMGLGAGVNAVRGGVEAGLMSRSAMSAAEGASVNVGLGAGIAGMDNHEYGWKDAINQSVAGAALGVLGGLIPHKTKLNAQDPGVKLDGIDELHDGATKTANDVINDMTAKDMTDNKGLGGRNAGVIDPHSQDIEKVTTPDEATPPVHVQDAIDRVKSDELKEQAADEQAKADEALPPTPEEQTAREDADLANEPSDAAADRVAAESRVMFKMTGNEVEALARDNRAAMKSGEMGTSMGTVREQLTRLSGEASDPQVKTLAGRLLEQLPEGEHGATVGRMEGRGTPNYHHSTHHITMYDDVGVSAEGATGNDRVLLHEIAHSVSAHKLQYGSAVPTSAIGQLTAQFEKLRARAEKVFREKNPDSSSYSMAQKETAYYLKNKDEFLAGLYSSHQPFVDHLRGIKVQGGNILSKTVDVVRAMLGLRKGESSAFTKALGLSDQIIGHRQATTFRIKGGGIDVKTPEYLTAHNPTVTRQDIPLGPLATQIEGQLKALAAKPFPKELEAMRQRGVQWYSNWRGKTGIGRALGSLDSVGLKLGLSDNPMVRAVSNLLCEDATGLNRAGGTSAAIEKSVLASNWRTPLINAWNELYPQLLTQRERAEVMAGAGNAALKRIGKQVQEERLQSRNARLGGTEYTSQAHPAVIKLAAAMDGLFKDMSEKGKAAGEERLEKISKSGWQGYMPYRFDDGALRQLYRDAGTDPARADEWNNLLANFREQYVSKLTEPMREKMSKAGPADERDVLRRVTEMAEKRTNDYFTQVMRTAGDRVLGADDHFANVAASMLDDVRALNGPKATRLTKKLIADFRSNLADVISDKSRTEFDLLKRTNGVRMLDYMDTDFGRMVEQNTSHYSGAIALARRGFKDDAHWSAAKEVLARNGASDEELSNLDFVHTSLTDEHHIKDNPAAAALQSATALAMMGKVGLNGLGDAGALVGAVGVGGFFKALAGSFGKDTALMGQLKRSATSALGLDHRLKFHDTTPGVQANPTSMMTHPMYRNAVKGLGTALAWMSLSKPIQMATHRAAVPAITEELVKAIRGAEFGEGGKIVSTGSSTLNPARLVDTGLTADRVKAIQSLMATHDAGRKEGDLIKWSAWDKDRPGYAEDFIGAIHRVTGQVLQRAYVGEQPRWQVETQMGRFFTQFRNQGMVGAEKQLARNMAHADRVTLSHFAFNTAWAGGLYWAKTMASTVGMTQAQRDDYLQKHFQGVQLASGVAAMTNVSGIASDTLDAVNMVFGGQSNGSSPFASMGYLKNVGGAVHSIGQQVSGSDQADIHKTVASVFKTLPLSNTFIGTGLVNGLQQQ